MGRKSDIKYKTKPSDVEALAALQKKILDAVCGYVRPGGVLLYSTCTIHPAENVDNVRYILEKGGYVLESLEPYLPKELCEGTTAKDGYLQLLSDTKLYYDGFFFARFRRVTPS
jgi:16S rRNA (cytosine967-C5)-methyltransferase